MDGNIDQKMQRWEFLAHATFLAHHLFASLYMMLFMDFEQSDQVIITDMGTYRYRYLTTWNFALQCVYLTMMVFAHIMRLFPQNKSLINARKIILDLRGYMYTSLVFPIGLLVFITFWTVWNINRELILPKIADTVIPAWMNHSIHTTILLVLLPEMFFYMKVPSFKEAARGALVFLVGYGSTFFFTYYQSTRWLYGLFAVLSWSERAYFMIISYFLALILIKLCMVIQSSLHHRKMPSGTHHKLISKKLM